jgi:PPOX class probable F420-dependent enzyme
MGRPCSDETITTVRGSAEIDTSTDFGARAARHLEDDQVVWLTTVGPDGTPQPSPVWFLWDGDTVLIYSYPATSKLRNIDRHPRVSPHFNCTASGGDVIILTGDA